MSSISVYPSSIDPKNDSTNGEVTRIHPNKTPEIRMKNVDKLEERIFNMHSKDVAYTGTSKYLNGYNDEERIRETITMSLKM